MNEWSLDISGKIPHQPGMIPYTHHHLQLRRGDVLIIHPNICICIYVRILRININDIYIYDINNIWSITLTVIRHSILPIWYYLQELIELVEEKRETGNNQNTPLLYLRVKTMNCCTFSQKPNHWSSYLNVKTSQFSMVWWLNPDFYAQNVWSFNPTCFMLKSPHQVPILFG